MEVRDLHPAFQIVRSDEAMALRALRRVYLSLLTEFVRERPESVTWTEVTAAIVSAHFTAGYNFSSSVAPLSVVSVDAQFANGEWREDLERVAWDGRDTRTEPSAVALRGHLLFPLGREPEWSGFSTWRVRYVPSPTALALAGAAASITALPDYCSPALVYGTAAELAPGAAHTVEGLDPGMYRDMAAEATARALATAQVDAAHEVFRKRDVMGW
jgi:hypothetical protein